MASFSEICAILARHYSASSSRTIVRMALRRTGLREDDLSGQRDLRSFVRELQRGMELFAASTTVRRLCTQELEALLSQGAGGSAHAESVGEITMAIVHEGNIVDARVRARGLAADLGFGRTDQVKVATIVSELARNIYHYAGKGEIIVRSREEPRRGIVIEARDDGPGIADVDAVLGGSYRSRTGLGLGLMGCKNLTDEFSIDTAPGKGTRVVACMYR